MLILGSVGAWLLLTLFNAFTVLGVIVRLPSTDQAEHLEAILSRLGRVSRWQNITSILSAGSLFAGFFGGALETSIWPWPVLAWVALWLQFLWVRPHLAVYVEVLRRDVARPTGRLLAVHLGFDTITFASLASVLAFGLA